MPVLPAHGRSANRLDPRTSAFAAANELCQYPPSLKLWRISPKPAAKADTSHGSLRTYSPALLPLR
jgi:hypothetical protein